MNQLQRLLRRQDKGPALRNVTPPLLTGGATASERLVSLVAPGSPEAEHYRHLRHAVERLRGTRECVIMAVCSAAASDGKTVTALNLAGALAQAPGAAVLAVELDLRRPAFARAEYLGLEPGAGIVDAIGDGNLGLEHVVRKLPAYNLSVLMAGRPAAAPYEDLKSPRLGRLLAEARRRYNYVIIDTPPVVPVPDCLLLAEEVDGFVVVVAADRTRQEMLAEALNLLDPQKVVGIVFNGCDPAALRRYGYEYVYMRARPRNQGKRGWWSRLLTPGPGAR